MFNTPSCFVIYTINLVLKWVEETIGGLDKMEQINEEKAGLLYDFIDKSDFYRGTAEKDSRSLMNVTFRLPSEDLEAKFVAEALEALLAEMGVNLAVVPYIKVAEHVLLARLAGRWTCRACGAMYHQVFSPPQEAGICDKCGGELYQRPDDTPDTKKHRIQVYFEQTAPLIDYYRERGLLVEVDGRPGIEEIQAELLDIIQGL